MMGTESYDSSGWLPSWLPFAGSIPVGIGAIAMFRRWRRYRRRHCPQCHARMAMLSDSEDDALLEKDKSQRTNRQRRLRRLEVPGVLASLHVALCEVAEPIREVPAVCQSHKIVDRKCHQRRDHELQRHRARPRKVCVLQFHERVHQSAASHHPVEFSSSSGSSGGSSFGGGSSGGGGASRGY